LRPKNEMSLREMNCRNTQRSDLCVFASGNYRYQQFLCITLDLLMRFGFCAIFDFHNRS
jgi:hypothetical protein